LVPSVVYAGHARRPVEPRHPMRFGLVNGLVSDRRLVEVGHAPEMVVVA